MHAEGGEVVHQEVVDALRLCEVLRELGDTVVVLDLDEQASKPTVFSKGGKALLHAPYLKRIPVMANFFLKLPPA